MEFKSALAAGLACVALSGCFSSGSSTVSAAAAAAPKNVIFFLGDGMGMTTMTAARIYSVGEDGMLTMDTLPETAFVKTFSNDAQVTDSAPSMSAYMTGAKMNNEVISMSANTQAVKPLADANGNLLTNNCSSVASNGTAVTTLAEIAKGQGMAAGVVSTTRITHATPAAVYSHICHRDLENDIAAALVPGGSGYNAQLGIGGMEVVLGGGLDHFKPYNATTRKGKRTDGRDLVAEMVRNVGYTSVSNAAEFRAVNPANTDRLVGLFTSSHMSYDLDRDPAKEPSLAEMTTTAMDVLSNNPKGYFLMVEGGRIDHALHETTGKKALQDTVAFDAAIKAAIDKAKSSDPTLSHTLIVVTADHDHTLVLNGYAKRLGKTTAAEPGVLGLVKNYVSGLADKDADGMPYTIMGFGNGENRTAGARSAAAALTDTQITASLYHQEAVVQNAAGSETHGGTDVFLGAIGKGAENFHGTIENIQVFNLIRTAMGL